MASGRTKPGLVPALSKLRQKLVQFVPHSPEDYKALFLIANHCRRVFEIAVHLMRFSKENRARLARAFAHGDDVVEILSVKFTHVF